jgi:hypothetical protein
MQRQMQEMSESIHGNEMKVKKLKQENINLSNQNANLH